MVVNIFMCDQFIIMYIYVTSRVNLYCQLQRYKNGLLGMKRLIFHNPGSFLIVFLVRDYLAQLKVYVVVLLK